MRAFLYSRVSTEEQNAGMQRAEMLEFVYRRGWKVAGIFEDVTSGARARRPGLDTMLDQVRRRKCDVVIVYRFDRFARSVRHLVTALDEFRALGVDFVSVHEAIDTSTPAGKLSFHIFAAMAEFEREILRERTRSGMAHARAQGKHIGRPRHNLPMAKIRAMRALGRPWSEVSAAVGVSERSLRRLVPKEAN